MSQPLFDRKPLVLEPPPRMTYEEFVAWKPDSMQAEWVDGEVIILTTSTRHVRTQRLMTTVLQTYVTISDLGEVFPAPFQMRLPFRPSGREPDLLFVRKENLHRVDRLWIDGPADLVIEILSEQTAHVDLGAKIREYERAGVPEYVMLDARDGGDEFRYLRLDADGRYQPVLPDAQGRYHAAVLPGFWFDPEWFRGAELPDAADLLFLIAPDAYWAYLGAKRRASQARSDHS